MSSVLTKCKTSAGVGGESQVDQRLTLPVAPQQASRASNITTLNPLALASSAKNLAAEAPVMPEPTMTTSALLGSSVVVRWPKRNSDGSLCQKEAVESLLGSLAILLPMK